MTDTPLLIRGMSRSGGTLVVTLLDAHPRVSMVYEFYPNLLKGASRADIDTAISLLESSSDLRRAAGGMPTEGLSKLVKRAPRAKLDNAGLGRLMRDHLNSGMGTEKSGDRLRFIERCARHGMSVDHKAMWGAKCGTNFEEYLEEWPKARFVNVIRDGRDVLASQLNTGSFNITPQSLGRSWTKNHYRFRNLANSGRIIGYELFYERLIDNPQVELQSLFEFLEIPFDDRVLEFHKQPLNIYRVGHMSKKALEKPINGSRIGRWRKDLSARQLAEFMEEARGSMAEFGYI